MRTSSIAVLTAMCAATALGSGGGECEQFKAMWFGPTTPAFDVETGRNLKQYPSHRIVDAVSMRLELKIPDMNVPRMTGVQTLTVETIGPREVGEIVIDAVEMKIESIAANGHDVKFEHADGKLRIMFSPMLKAGSRTDIVTKYIVDNPSTGLHWTTESPAWPGRPAQIHTQGQPQTNSYWFPCLDFPNERLMTEIIAEVPAGNEVLSNGRLVSKSTKDGVARFHWLQDKTHVNYLVSLVVGKFDIVDVGTSSLPMPVYAPVGRGHEVKATFGRTPEMMRLFENITGQKYPWDQYAQSIVWNFGAGGMENTSTSTLHESSLIRKEALNDSETQGLIAHELAHQWFGDLLTCNSWEHIWLNEGFATYFTNLWFEKRDGLDAYFGAVQGQFDGIVQADVTMAPMAGGMGSKMYAHPWEVFRRASNPYGKGASVLHMLRVALGDELFQKGIALHVKRRAFKTMETSDLREAFEEVSGRDLHQFFRQWIERPGVPRLNIKTSWADGHVEVSIEQTQLIDGDNPAFEFALPLAIAHPDGSVTMERVAMSERSREAKIPCAAKPLYVAVDPLLALLAEKNISQPVEAWRVQARSGPTLPAKVQALRALVAVKDEASLPVALQYVDDRGASIQLRTESMSLVSACASDDALIGIAIKSDAWQLRTAAVNAMKERASASSAKFASIVLNIARDDASGKVRAAAIRALPSFGQRESTQIVESALATEWQDDALRQAGLDALVAIGGRESLVKAISCTKEGFLPRTRAHAAGVVVKLASTDPDLAYQALVAMLNSNELRTRMGAGQSLVDLGDKRAINEFDAMISKTPTKDVAWMVGGWKKALEAK